MPGTLPLDPGLLLWPLTPGETLFVPGVTLFLPYGDTYAPPLVAEPVYPALAPRTSLFGLGSPLLLHMISSRFI